MRGPLMHMAYAAVAAAGRLKRTPGVSVLTYHSIDDSGSSISTSEAEFRSQMEWLALAGYRTSTLSDVARGRQHGVSFSKRVVVLTFDDAYESMYTLGYPIMQEFGFKATVFAPAAYLGTSNRWVGQTPTAPSMPLMDWSALDEVADAGFEIGSHTLTHVHLSDLPMRDMRREVHDSKRLIEDKLGRPVLSFCYPFGQYGGAAVTEVRRAGYVCGCTTDCGRFTERSHAFVIRRLSVGSGTGIPRFRLLVSSSAWLLAFLKTHVFHSH